MAEVSWDSEIASAYHSWSDHFLQLAPLPDGSNPQVPSQKHWDTPPKFNDSSPLKNDAWKTTFLLELQIFRRYVKLRSITSIITGLDHHQVRLTHWNMQNVHLSVKELVVPQ